jgi:hypothetical protein
MQFVFHEMTSGTQVPPGRMTSACLEQVCIPAAAALPPGRTTFTTPEQLCIPREATSASLGIQLPPDRAKEDLLPPAGDKAFGADESHANKEHRSAFTEQPRSCCVIFRVDFRAPAAVGNRSVRRLGVVSWPPSISLSLSTWRVAFQDACAPVVLTGRGLDTTSSSRVTASPLDTCNSPGSSHCARFSDSCASARAHPWCSAEARAPAPLCCCALACYLAARRRWEPWRWRWQGVDAGACASMACATSKPVLTVSPTSTKTRSCVRGGEVVPHTSRKDIVTHSSYGMGMTTAPRSCSAAVAGIVSSTLSGMPGSSTRAICRIVAQTVE